MTIATPPTTLNPGDDSGGSVTNFTSATITPTHGTDGCTIIWFGGQDTSGPYPSGISSPSGLGLTWTVINFEIQSTGSTRWFLAAVVGVGTPSSGTFTCTITGSSATRLGYIVEQVDSGIDASNPGSWVTGSANSASATSLAPTVASAGANDLIVAGAVHRVNEDITCEHNEVNDFSNASPSYHIATQYNLGNSDLSMGFSWATTQTCAAVAFVIPAGSSGSTPTPSAIVSTTAFPTPVQVAQRSVSTLVEVSAFPSPTMVARKVVTALAETTAFPSPTVIVPKVSPWTVVGTTLELNNVKTTVKGVNQFVGANWGDDSVTLLFDGTGLTDFVADLVSGGINLVRLPILPNMSGPDISYLMDVIEALADSGIYSLIEPHAANGVWNGLTWPTDTTTNDSAIDAATDVLAVYTAASSTYKPWILLETLNEPVQDWNTPTDTADWVSGSIAAIDVYRNGNYDGPIFVDGTNFSWTLAQDGSPEDVLAHDDQVVFTSHRYATPDGTTYMGDTDPTDNWKPQWPDFAASIGACFVQGEFGPFNSGLGGNTLQYNLDHWVTDLISNIETANGIDHCAGAIGWIWVWSDDNTMNDYGDWQGGTITQTNFGALVYGMFATSDVTVTPLTTLAGTTSFPSPVIRRTPLPATLAETSAFPSPSLIAQKAVTSLSEVTAFPAPTVIGSSKTTPSALAEVTSFPTPTVTGAALITPGALAEVTAFPSPTILLQAKPTVLVETSAFPAPTVQGGALISATALVDVTAFPSPTVVAGTSPVPSALAEVTAFPSATVTGAARSTPAALATVDAFPAPTLVKRALPAALAEVTAFPATIIRRTPLPITIATIDSFPSPSVSASTNVVIPDITYFRLITQHYQFRLTGPTLYNFLFADQETYDFRIA